jgi:hypothetical protein
MAHAAVGVIMVPLRGKEVPWELGELRKDRLLNKTVFLLPKVADAKKAGGESSENFLEELRRDGFELPPLRDDVQMVSLDQNGKLVRSDYPRGWLGRLSEKRIRRALHKNWGRVFG